MASFTQSWSYMVAALVSFSLCFLVGTCVVVLNVYLYRQRQSKSKGPTSIPSTSMEDLQTQVHHYFHVQVHEHVLRYCTGLSLSSFYLQIVMAFFYRLNEMRVFGGHNWCAAYITSSALLWTFGKYQMYMVFIARVRVAFKATLYGYSNRTIIGLYIFVSALFVPMALALFFLSGGHTEDVTGNAPSDEFTVCVSDINPYMLVAGFLIDISFSPALVLLFVRPMRMFFRDTSDRASTIGESVRVSIRKIEVQMLPLKYTVSVTIGVMSTFCGMILMAATDAGVLVIMDSVVNMICLLSMTAHWKHVYWRLCAPLLTAIAFFNCCFDDKLRNNLLRIIAHFASGAEMSESRKSMSSKKVKGHNSQVNELGSEIDV